MPYNPDLDENMFSKSHESEAGRLTVSVYSYNKGIKKLQITRETRDQEGNFRFSKLGRMTREEVEGILPFIKEAVGSMD